jgi:hypothetical protein
MSTRISMGPTLGPGTVHPDLINADEQPATAPPRSASACWTNPVGPIVTAWRTVRAPEAWGRRRGRRW